MARMHFRLFHRQHYMPLALGTNKCKVRVTCEKMGGGGRSEEKIEGNSQQ